MNKLSIILLAFVISAPVFASQSPYLPEIDARFAALEAGTSFGAGSVATAAIADSAVTSVKIADGTIVAADIATSAVTSAKILDGTVTEADMIVQSADGNHLKRIARATLDCASSGCSVGAHTLGVSLPAKALITRSYINVVTQFSDTGTCTVAIHCEDANNIKTATDITATASGGFIEGASTGAASAFVGSISATCVITATVADGGSCVPVAGKANIFVEYNVIE